MKNLGVPRLSPSDGCDSLQPTVSLPRKQWWILDGWIDGWMTAHCNGWIITPLGFKLVPCKPFLLSATGHQNDSCLTIPGLQHGTVPFRFHTSIITKSNDKLTHLSWADNGKQRSRPIVFGTAVHTIIPAWKCQNLSLLQMQNTAYNPLVLFFLLEWWFWDQTWASRDTFATFWLCSQFWI